MQCTAIHDLSTEAPLHSSQASFSWFITAHLALARKFQRNYNLILMCFLRTFTHRKKKRIGSGDRGVMEITVE